MAGILEKRRGGHSAISNADLRRCAPAPIYGSSESGEVSTDLESEWNVVIYCCRDRLRSRSFTRGSLAVFLAILS